MRYYLSHTSTFSHKFVLPTIWLSGFTAGTVLMILQGRPQAYQFALATLVGGLLLRNAFCLKRVLAADGGIYISNFLREVFVPYNQIYEVREYMWPRQPIIRVGFRSPNAFGTEIVFMPFGSTWFPPWKAHPIAQFLRQRSMTTPSPIQSVG
ncbi:MAG: hypothetical protein KC492_16280 [Myxococcales bacterium]|nr:hypothetical protein [Myxococcales bacterium]